MECELRQAKCRNAQQHGYPRVRWCVRNMSNENSESMEHALPSSQLATDCGPGLSAVDDHDLCLGYSDCVCFSRKPGVVSGGVQIRKAVLRFGETAALLNYRSAAPTESAEYSASHRRNSRFGQSDEATPTTIRRKR